MFGCSTVSFCCSIQTSRSLTTIFGVSFVLAGIASSSFYLPAPMAVATNALLSKMHSKLVALAICRHATTLHGSTGCIWQQWLAIGTLKTFCNPASLWVGRHPLLFLYIGTLIENSAKISFKDIAQRGCTARRFVLSLMHLSSFRHRNQNLPPNPS